MPRKKVGLCGNPRAAQTMASTVNFFVSYRSQTRAGLPRSSHPTSLTNDTCEPAVAGLITRHPPHPIRFLLH